MPLVDSLSPRRRSGERVRERGFQLAAPIRWKVPLSPSPLPARASQGEGAGGGDDGGILMRPSNPLHYFRFAAIGRVIILAVMAYRTFISSGLILAAFQAVAAEQTSTAVVDKGTKSLDWWKEKISHYVDTHGPALAGAVIVLVAGFYASRLLGKIGRASCRERGEVWWVGGAE